MNIQINKIEVRSSVSKHDQKEIVNLCKFLKIIAIYVYVC